METISYRFDRKLPVVAEADVLVVGAGPGGVSAAVMSARTGADTLIAERYGCPGGMAVFGEVTPFMRNHLDGKTLDRPIFQEWSKRLHAAAGKDGWTREPFDPEMTWRFFNKEHALMTMEEMLLDSGVRMLYHHTLVDVIMNGDTIAAAVFHSKSGFVAVRAKIFIDSTGDGDLAVLAGAPAEFGNGEGFCQPMTTCFKLIRVEKDRIPPREEINALYDRAKAEGKIDCPREDMLWFSMPDADTIHFNTTRIIRKSAVSGVELSEAEIEGRRQVRQFIAFLREQIPGFEHAALGAVALHVGVRESRRIRGIIYQTAEDFFRAAKYPDGIAKVHYIIDIHNPNGSGTRIERLPENEWYELRYGTLVPEHTANLLMGCRAISLDQALHSSCRVMPPICSIGQAAGMAAALCVKRRIAPAALDGCELRRLLAQAGAWL